MPDRNCIVCGRTFAATYGAQRLCGPECRSERDRFHFRQFKAKGSFGPVRKQCVICSAEFIAGKSEARPRKSTTCSRDCQTALQLRTTMQGYYERRARLQHCCVECGTLFLAIDRPRKKTCSERCAQHRRRDQVWRHRQVQKALGQKAMYEAQRRASGYMKRYKRQWRRRRAEERAQMELILLTAAVGTLSPTSKGAPHGKCD